MKKRVVICGITGRMGNALSAAIGRSDDLELIGGIADEGEGTEACPIVRPDAAGALLGRADALIDFSAPAALASVLRSAGSALESKVAVIGTTGLGEDQEAAIDELARKAAVVTAANFSVGVNVLLDLVERAAAALDQRFDIEIVETHHRMKVDAPSGTALALARAAAHGRSVDLSDVRRDGRSGDVGARPAGEIGIHAVRGGAVVGEHRVHFLADAERLELTHIANDRGLFAEGALTAVRWAHGKPAGRYTMRNVLGL